MFQEPSLKKYIHRRTCILFPIVITKLILTISELLVQSAFL